MSGALSVHTPTPRVPGEILYEADRLESLFFAGYDPHFERDEPPPDPRPSSGSKSFARRGRRSASRGSWFRPMFTKAVLSAAILSTAPGDAGSGGGRDHRRAGSLRRLSSAWIVFANHGTAQITSQPTRLVVLYVFRAQLLNLYDLSLYCGNRDCFYTSPSARF